MCSCVSLHMLCACLCPAHRAWRCWTPGARVADGVSHLGYLGLLEGQQMPLTAEASLQPHVISNWLLRTHSQFPLKSY